MGERVPRARSESTLLFMRHGGGGFDSRWERRASSPAWMTKHAAGGGVEREHPEVNRLVRHGHGGEPDTADGGQCACGVYRPLVAEALTALAISGAAFADRLGADVMVHGVQGVELR
jgi:hypothetical protein